MRYICLALIASGAVIMLCGIVKYYKSLVSLKIKAYEDKVFTSHIYMFSFVLMLFFLVGYIAVAISLFVSVVDTRQFMVSLIFFFGAIFVFLMVTVEDRMSQTISSKTGEIVSTLVNAVEAKDPYTRGHSAHVLNIVKVFYKRLPEDIKYGIKLPWLLDAAILHDIGKIGIEDKTLNKPGPLDDEEWESIRRHPVLGKRILENTSYAAISHIIYCHHERVDGKGYYGIPGDEIPVEAKIIAVADTFSAVCTDRVYRKKQTYERAMEIMREAAGTQLDLALVSVFTAIEKKELEKAGIKF